MSPSTQRVQASVTFVDSALLLDTRRCCQRTLKALFIHATVGTCWVPPPGHTTIRRSDDFSHPSREGEGVPSRRVACGCDAGGGTHVSRTFCVNDRAWKCRKFGHQTADRADDETDYESPRIMIFDEIMTFRKLSRVQPATCM